MPGRSPEEISDLKQRACARIDEIASALVDVSRKIWEHPEIAFQEHDASRWLGELLADAGYDVEIGAGGLAAVLDDLPGTVRVHGTPAEEGPSGKTLLLRAGVFEGLDAALIFHPSAEANVLERMRTGHGIVFTFTGKHAHAAANPELAVDALNGVLALFNNVNLLRQHFRPDVSVTGSILEGAGRSPSRRPRGSWCASSRARATSSSSARWSSTVREAPRWPRVPTATWSMASWSAA